MVRECCASREFQPGCFEPRKELLRARNAAERGDGTIGGWDLNSPADAPDWPGPAPYTKFVFEGRIFRWNGENACAASGLCRFAKIPRRQQMIVPVFAIDEQDIDVACEL